jgi:transcriptional regulator with XRE-family HTH domain
MIQQTIAEAINHWREVRGLSQRALAERSGLSYVHIARLELAQGNPTVATLETLAEALGVDVVDFFTAPIKAKRPAQKRARGKR